MGVKHLLKRFIFEHKSLHTLLRRLHRPGQGTCELVNKGMARLHKDIQGAGHAILIGEGAVLEDTAIRIRGTNNRLVFGKNCYVGKDCSFWLEGSNLTITIGEGTTFTARCHLNAQEQGCSITVGRDCMFSNQVIVRTSDSHPILDRATGQRLNPAGDVVIGDHVWIAPNSKVMKGVTIGTGSIIGSDTMVTKAVPEYVLAVGHPARVVKENIHWTRENVLF